MKAKELFEKHLSFVSHTPSADEVASVYTPDVKMEFVYAPEDHTKTLAGPEAIVNFLGRIPTFAEGFGLSPITFHETTSGGVAEYKGSATFKSTGNPYNQEYIVVVTVENDRIANLKEYYDPMRVLRAMGEIE